MSLKKTLLVFLVYLNVIASAQQDSFPKINKWLSKHKALENYVHFLKHDSLQKNTFFMLAFNYMYTNQSKIAHGGRGGYISGGVNLARLFTKKIVLGGEIELKAWKGLWPHYFTKNFIADFNAAFHNELSGEDSARAVVLKECINGSERYKRRGTFYSAMGIAFSPFPSQYGGFMLILKRGFLSIPVHGTFGTLFNQKGSDWVSISSSGFYSAELVLKPLTFFKATKHDEANGILQFSLFYQQVSWKDPYFDELPISRVTNTGFINKYAIQQHFGVTIKIGMY